VLEDRGVAGRHGQPSHQPLSRPTAAGVSEQPHQLEHAAGSVRKRFSHGGKAFDKGLSLTLFVATSPAAQPQLQHHTHALRRQIL